MNILCSDLLAAIRPILPKRKLKRPRVIPISMRYDDFTQRFVLVDGVRGSLLANISVASVSGWYEPITIDGYKLAHLLKTLPADAKIWLFQENDRLTACYGQSRLTLTGIKLKKRMHHCQTT